MKKKKLILLTSEFPYGKGETFLETEIIFLAEEFDEVQIISSAQSLNEKRILPNNVTCELFSNRVTGMDKVKALLGLFSSDLRTEKKRVQNSYRLEWTKGVRNTALISYYLGKKWQSRLMELLAQSSDYETTFYSYWCTDTALGLALLRRSDPSVHAFSRVHGWDLYFEATAFNYQPFRGFISDQLTRLFPISDKGKTYILERWQVEHDRVEVERLGTITTQKNVLELGRNCIVSCSSMIPLKRVQLIAESLRNIDFQLDWYHFGDGSERSNIEEVVATISNDEVKVRLMGHVSNTEVLEWYRQHKPDVFLNVSTTEGIPVSIMEAMSFGIPCLATNVGGTSEIVNSENGSLLDVEIGPKELAEKIKDVFQMTEQEREELSRCAYETWQTKYSAETNYAQFAKRLLK